MPFPFLPTGAIVAATVLGGAIAGFVAAMMALDKAGSRIFGAVVSGVVSGARSWGDGLLTRRVSNAGRAGDVDPDGPRGWGRRAAALRVERDEERRRIATMTRVTADGHAIAGVDDDGPSLLTEDGVEPIETLDRVRPHVR